MMLILTLTLVLISLFTSLGFVQEEGKKVKPVEFKIKG